MRLLLPTLLALLPAAALAASPSPVLTKGFTVYSDDTTVAWNPSPGLTSRVVPVWNQYRGSDGGYVACYSHDLAHAAYRVSADIGVVGLVRLRGSYESGRIFQPSGYRGQDISALARFKALCGRALKACRGQSCWAGGDTGGFVGQ